MQEKNQTEPLIYKDWMRGIADSPTDGFAEIRNCNIERFPGNITPGWKTVQTNTVGFGAVSVVRFGATDFIQFNAGSATPYIGQAVVFSASGGGITAGQIYYLTNQLQIFSSTTWLSPIANDIHNALVNTAVGLSAGVTGNISSINMATVIDFKTYYPSFYGGNPLTFCIDTNSRVWVQDNITNAGTMAVTKNNWYYLPRTATDTAVVTPNTQGLTIFQSFTSPSKSFLFAAFNTVLSVIEIDALVLNSSIPSWTASFTTFSTAYYHRGFVSQSGAMYFTDGNKLLGFAEVSTKTFSPADNTTYALNPAAISLPSFEIGTCIDNLGDNLMVGGLNSNLIYPWNEIQQVVTLAASAGVAIFASYQSPVRVGEKGIYQLKNINNTLYILAGVKGIIYYTSGYVVLPLCKIPEYLTGGSVFWGGIEKIDGNLLFGFLGSQTDQNAPVGGVGKLFLTEQAQATSIIADGVLVIDQSTSTNPTTTNPTALYTYILPQPIQALPTSELETYFIGSVNGVDVVDITTPRSDGSSYVITALENVSSLKSTRSFQNIGVSLLQPIASTQSINIQYRSALNGSFTAINASNPTFDASTFNGTATNAFANSQIQNVNLNQVKIILTADASATSTNRAPILNNVILQ